MEGLLSTEILVEKHFVRCWIIFFSKGLVEPCHSTWNYYLDYFLLFRSRKLCLHLDPMLCIRITLIWIRIRIRPFTLIGSGSSNLSVLNRQQFFNNSCSNLYLLCVFISGLEAELFHPLFQRATWKYGTSAWRMSQCWPTCPPARSEIISLNPLTGTYAKKNVFSVT